MSYRLPQCILFDLDGTLLDSLPGIEFSVKVAMTSAGLPAQDLDLKPLIGPPIRGIMSKALQIEDPAVLDELEKHFRTSYDTEGWTKTPCFKGARETLLQMTANGHRLFVVSNKPRHVSTQILEAEGVLGLFERIYTRDSREPKYASKAEMLECLLHDLVIEPSETLMVGDTIEDASSAKSNRIPFAYMEHGYGEVPLTEPAVLRLRSFKEFLPHMAMENAE